MHGVLIPAYVLGASLSGPATALAMPGEGFEVIRYKLALQPNISAKTIVGHETIVLRATSEELKRLTFSANALTIDSASINGRPLSADAQEEVLGFNLPQPLSRGHSVTLRLTYHGRPARGFIGSATTLYTSYFACDWMVCAQNKFGEKAAFSLDLTVPAGMTSLSLGHMIAKRRGPAGSEIHSWRAPRPYSAYLFGFAVGPFARFSETSGSRRLTYLSDVVTSDELSRRFTNAGEIVAFLSAKAGMPLPVAEYSQLLVGGDEAQEAATYSVLGTNALPAKADDPAEDWAIVHELAHQWWGNLITCKSLQEFWLNEGITTFMTAAWKEHRYGRSAYDAELDVARRRVERARAAGFDKPLAWGGAYPNLGTRRAIQYSKGALFMANLRDLIGDNAFWSGLARYTREHAGGTVTSIDLQRAMEAASGRDLRLLFADWVFGPDRSLPLIRSGESPS